MRNVRYLTAKSSDCYWLLENINPSWCCIWLTVSGWIGIIKTMPKINWGLGFASGNQSWSRGGGGGAEGFRWQSLQEKMRFLQFWGGGEVWRVQMAKSTRKYEISAILGLWTTLRDCWGHQTFNTLGRKGIQL